MTESAGYCRRRWHQRLLKAHQQLCGGIQCTDDQLMALGLADFGRVANSCRTPLETRLAKGVLAECLVAALVHSSRCHGCLNDRVLAIVAGYRPQCDMQVAAAMLATITEVLRVAQPCVPVHERCEHWLRMHLASDATLAEIAGELATHPKTLAGC